MQGLGSMRGGKGGAGDVAEHRVKFPHPGLGDPDDFVPATLAFKLAGADDVGRNEWQVHRVLAEAGLNGRNPLTDP